MATANSIIKGAFRLAGVITKGETPDSDETQDALESLNDLVESLSNDSLFITSRTVESFALTSGQITYTIGTGGDFNTSRPMNILSAYVRVGNVDYDVAVISDEAYAELEVKSTGGIPYFLNYNPGYPLGTLNIYPSPASGYTLYLVTEKPLSTFTLNQEVSMAPGWNRFLKNQLAIEIAPEYGVQIPQEAVINAREAMKLIKTNVAKITSMDYGAAQDNNNIYTGYYF